MDKCGVCKRYEEGECPCHLNIDDELCDFAFELIDIKEHDAKVRADAIDEVIDRLSKMNCLNPIIILELKHIKEKNEKD